MALEKAHSGSKKMTFGENRDLEEWSLLQLHQVRASVLTSILMR